MAVLFSTGVSLGADGSGLSATFPDLAARTAVVLGHLSLGPGMLRFPGALQPEAALRKRVAALGRGALLAAPVMVVVGVLPTLAPSLGTTEAAVMLSGLCALYMAFIVAQFVALSGAGHASSSRTV